MYANTDHKVHFGLLYVLALCVVGCGAEATGGQDDESGCAGGKCDDPNPGGFDPRACARLRDMSGNALDPSEILGHVDPLAQIVDAAQAELEGDPDAEATCTLADMVNALVDVAGCTDLRSSFVSERSQLRGASGQPFSDYRTLTQLTCPGEDGIDREIILHYGVLNGRSGQLQEDGFLGFDQALDQTFPSVMAETTTGVFNYYRSTGQEILFFGSSLDMLDGTRLDRLIQDGRPISAAQTNEVERVCAACHAGGGVTMKELRSPWLHWEAGGHFSSPDTDTLIDSSTGLLGRHIDGFDFDQFTRGKNRQVNARRIEHIRDNLTLPGDARERGSFTVADLLRPVFCTVEFNTGSALSRPGVVSSLPLNQAVLDDGLTFTALRNLTDEYETVLNDRGSHLQTIVINPETGAFETQRLDQNKTLGGMTFVERGLMDIDYEGQLVGANIIDRQFVAAVRSVDFTRSVYSDERCDLLQYAAAIAPEVVAVDGAADEVRDGFIAALEARREVEELEPAEADFLAALTAEDPRQNLKQRASAFASACTARAEEDALALVTDYMGYVGQVRKRSADPAIGIATGDASFAQFTFAGVHGMAMPLDEVDAEPGLRLHPETCLPTTAYVGLVEE